MPRLHWTVDGEWPEHVELVNKKMGSMWYMRADLIEERRCRRELVRSGISKGGYWYRCSGCGSGLPLDSRYCPRCGAKVVSE